MNQLFEFKTIANFDQYERAHLYKYNLEQAGMPCILTKEAQSVALKVSSFQVKTAKQLLDHWQATPFLGHDGQAICCPKCGSKHINQGSKVVNSFRDLVAALGAVLTFSYAKKFRRPSSCQDCEHIF